MVFSDERGVLVPYTATEARRAGSDGDLPYSQGALIGYHPGIPIPCRLMPPPRFLPPFPMMRPPVVPMLPPFPPHMMPPPPPPMHMMPPPPPPIVHYHSGLPPRFPPGMFPPPPPPLRMMPPPHFLRPYDPMSPQLGRPRTPNEGPIVTGPESVYGTLPRVSAYEEPLYMQGNLPYMPPQASYQPSNYPPEQYDAYYDTYKRQRSPPTKEKSIGSQTSSKREEVEQDEASQFWDAYETGIYKKPYLNEKAFFATIRSSSAGVNEPSTTAEVEVPRPETPPADYETAFEGMHISNKQTQQRTTAVMY
ncbi:unnamed protein product [Enterobius vermicularis]|uniref:Uncharacterized protein n=1 Tax=Enterobius vermicularis TaxID=51028 RepID=A0A3P6INU0_ENTVE|nr:unnamed protein product [Enterobius vermicularis]